MNLDKWLTDTSPSVLETLEGFEAETDFVQILRGLPKSKYKEEYDWGRQPITYPFKEKNNG